MTEQVFQPFPKIPRLFREMTVTEKIDGTNACVVIPEYEMTNAGIIRRPEVYAQSRKRVITPDDDNFGFAAWVDANRETLIDDLGPGRHFGEWWGSGIQRGYGLPKGERRFSLFNTEKWDGREPGMEDHYAPDFDTPGLGVVPVVYEGPFDNTQVRWVLADLAEEGSHLVHGFMNPEGVVVYLPAGNHLYKVTLERDEEPKSMRGAA